MCPRSCWLRLSAPLAQTPAAAPAYRNDPKFQDAWREAKATEKERQYAFIADAYKKANKIAGGQCLECLQSMYKWQSATGQYKDALASATLLQAAATTPALKSNAAALRSDAILAQAGDKPKPAQLEAANAALKEAIELNPKSAGARFREGQVLARMGKMDEAKAEFTECVHCISPKDPSRLRAQHFAENPAISNNKMAPAFEVTALDGKKFNLDAMGGRVVLIDFWATWCGPCNEELPHVKQIAKEFAGQPLVIISVSWDSDETQWKDFINKNEMTWVQYRDKDHALSKAFGVQSIPHYFTIDSDGVLTAEMMGSGSNVEGKLKKLVARAHEAQPAPAATAIATGN